MTHVFVELRTERPNLVLADVDLVRTDAQLEEGIREVPHEEDHGVPDEAGSRGPHKPTTESQRTLSAVVSILHYGPGRHGDLLPSLLVADQASHPDDRLSIDGSETTPVRVCRPRD